MADAETTTNVVELHPHAPVRLPTRTPELAILAAILAAMDTEGLQRVSTLLLDGLARDPRDSDVRLGAAFVSRVIDAREATR